MFRIEFDEEEKKIKAFTLPILTRHFYDMSNMMSRNEGLFILSHHKYTYCLVVTVAFNAACCKAVAQSVSVEVCRDAS